MSTTMATTMHVVDLLRTRTGAPSRCRGLQTFAAKKQRRPPRVKPLVGSVPSASARSRTLADRAAPESDDAVRRTDRGRGAWPRLREPREHARCAEADPAAVRG